MVRRLDPKAEHLERVSNIVAITVLTVVVFGTWNSDSPKSLRTVVHSIYNVLDSTATQTVAGLGGSVGGAVMALRRRKVNRDRRRKESKARLDARKRAARTVNRSARFPE